MHPRCADPPLQRRANGLAVRNWPNTPRARARKQSPRGRVDHVQPYLLGRPSGGKPAAVPDEGLITIIFAGQIQLDIACS